MGTLTGIHIIARVRDTLVDTIDNGDGLRWPDAELLRYINDAQRAIAQLRPDSTAVTRSVLLTAGNTRQSIPTSAIRLMSIDRNMGSDGLTPGRAIRVASRATLDTQIPYWHSYGPTQEIVHFLFDIREPRAFYVYPYPAANVYVEMTTSDAPIDLATTASTIYQDDIYENSIIAFVLMRAYGKDDDYTRNADAASAWATMFNSGLSARTQVDGGITPNKAMQTGAVK